MAGCGYATMNMASAISDLLVLELGDRVGAGACGSLLAQLGAEVVLVEPADINQSMHKWRNRAVVAAGKRSLVDNACAPGRVMQALLESADVLLLSSDIGPALNWSKHERQIVCDITACGSSGPLAGRAYSDALVQALTGIVDTTGDPFGPPSIVGFEMLEFAAGTYAVSAILAALRVRRRCGLGQDVEVALFDSALAALSTFLPFPMVGKSVTRSANRHALTAPWNAYRATDGWIQICAATDEQWRRLADALEVDSSGFDTNTERVARMVEVDTMVQSWVSGMTVRQCIEHLTRIKIACGPIVTVEELAEQENLLHRKMVRHGFDPVSGRTFLLPGSPLKATRTPGVAPASIARPDQDRRELETRVLRSRPRTAAARADEPVRAPLAGVRVVEIGHFTTAPLVTRQLGALGADVLKIEPPGGESSRNWVPTQGEQGYFFTLNNSDKKSVTLDLKSAADKARLHALLRNTDILVENMKPGALARLGLGAEELTRANPGLVYCAISGFGGDSTYPGRPAFDTVVQAMCGVMDLTRVRDIPTKTGISCADVLGGEFALVAVLAALEYRDRTGLGQSIDIAMQDVGAWITQMEWTRAARVNEAMVIQCCDGYAAVDGVPAQIRAWFAQLASSATELRTERTRAELVEAAGEAGFLAAAVNSISEIVNHPHVRARQLVVYRSDADGVTWPLLNSPLRLSLTPAMVARPIGALGEANAETFGRPRSHAETALPGGAAA